MSALAQPLARRQAIDVAAAAIMVWLTFSWGLNGVAAKIGNSGYNPIVLSIVRSVIAAVLVFAWCRWRRIPLFDRDRTLLPGILAGALFGAEFALIFFGLEFTTVARSTLLVNTMPFWVLVGAHFLLGERMSGGAVAGLLLAFAGVVVVFSDRLSSPGPDAWMGDLMSIGAGALWGATTLAIRRSTLAAARAEKVLLYQLVAAPILSLPLLPLGGAMLREPDALNTAALLFQGVYIAAFTYMVWFWMVARYPAAGLSSFAFLTPVFGVLLGAIVLDEPLTWRIGLALALIATGILIVNRPARRQAVISDA
ncbi:MAG: DMT family transporter [Rhizobiaceae bacterium]